MIIDDSNEQTEKDRRISEAPMKTVMNIEDLQQDVCDG